MYWNLSQVVVHLESDCGKIYTFSQGIKLEKFSRKTKFCYTTRKNDYTVKNIILKQSTTVSMFVKL